MKKKILAVLLAAILCFAVPVSVSAAAVGENETSFSAIKKLSSSLLEKLGASAGNISISADSEQELQNRLSVLMANTLSLLGTEKGSTAALMRQAAADTESGLPAAVGTADYTVKAKELSSVLGKYLFVKVDNASDAAAIIAADSGITYHTLEDGSGTLYISVNIEENPEIFNYAVFRGVVEALYERQNEALLTDRYGKVDYVMSYEHIAGELALHMILLAAVSNIITLTKSSDARLAELYSRAAAADLNIDETRVPSFLIRFIGSVIMNTVTFAFYKLFGLI